MVHLHLVRYADGQKFQPAGPTTLTEKNNYRDG